MQSVNSNKYMQILKHHDHYINVDKVMNKMNSFSSEYNKYAKIKSVLVYDQTNVIVDKSVTIVIPTLSRYDSLLELLEMLNKQNGNKKFQIIIVDNCGTEDNRYKNFILHLKIYKDLNIKYYVNEINIGMIGNWNRCIALAQTPLVSIIHDDDLVDKNYNFEIHKCLKTINIKDIKFGILKVRNKIFYTKDHLNLMLDRKNKNRGGIIEIKKKDLILVGYPISNPPTCGMIINKKAFIECGGFNEYTYPSSDFFLGIQMLRKGFRIFETEDILGYYRLDLNESMKFETLKKFCYMGTFIMAYAFYIFKNTYSEYIYNCWYKDWLYGHLTLLKNYRKSFDHNEIDVLGKLRINSLYKIERKCYRLYKRIYIFLMNLAVLY